MRILHVTDTFLPKIGGTEITIDQLLRAMAKLGVESVVLAPRPRGGKFSEADAPYAVQRYIRPRSSLWAGWWIWRQIVRAEKRWGTFDAIVAHHAFPPGYACVKHAAGRLPVIVYVHGGDVYEGSRWRKKPRAWRKLAWALARSSAVVSGSAAMENLVRPIIGASAASHRLVRIANGVNLAEIRDDVHGSRFEEDQRLRGSFILALGRTIRRKGFDLLIDAFAKSDPQSRNEWKLVIAGDGAALSDLRQQAAPLGEQVIFTGTVEGADKNWLLHHCRFMAAPSREEAFGLVALEGMACGKAVIASNASGFAEIIRDGVNGRLVDIRRPEFLQNALLELMRSDASAIEVAARETAERYDWSAAALRWRELIERLVRLVPSPRGRGSG